MIVPFLVPFLLFAIVPWAVCFSALVWVIRRDNQRYEYLFGITNHFIEKSVEMRSAIDKVLSQKLDDLCWMDFYDLAGAAELPYPDLRLLPREVMLRNCTQYVDCLMKCPGDREEATRLYKLEKGNQ